MEKLKFLRISFCCLVILLNCVFVLTATAENCLKLPEVGSCSNYTVRWYFNQTERDCRMFWFGGCDAGENNFLTQDVCKNACSQTKTGKLNHLNYRN